MRGSLNVFSWETKNGQIRKQINEEKKTRRVNYISLHLRRDCIVYTLDIRWISIEHTAHKHKLSLKYSDKYEFGRMIHPPPYCSLTLFVLYLSTV